MSAALVAMTPAERQRVHRSRQREARAAAWTAEYPATWRPLLEAWARRGLRRPPSDAQLALLRPYAERERGPRLVGSLLQGFRRARARHSPTTYRLVAALIRALDQVRRLTAEARDAFDRPLDLLDPDARRERGEGSDAATRPPVRSSVRRSPGQLPTGSLGQLLRQHGLRPELAEELERRRDR